MPLSKGPLTDRDYMAINKELTRQEALRQMIEQAKDAGFPCDDEDEACKAIRDQLSRIKKVYFPERP